MLKIATSDFVRDIQKYDELTTVVRVLSIYEKETAAGKTSLLARVTSVVELQEAYMKTVFGMRRLELDMPKECRNEFLQLIVRYDMSEIYLRECLFYINQLEIPEGYSVDVITITEATSSCSS